MGFSSCDVMVELVERWRFQFVSVVVATGCRWLYRYLKLGFTVVIPGNTGGR